MIHVISFLSLHLLRFPYSLVANVTLIGGKTVIQSEQLLNCFQFDKYRSLVKSRGFSQGTYWFQQTMVKLIKDD